MDQESFDTFLQRSKDQEIDSFDCIEQLMVNYKHIGVTHFIMEKLSLVNYTELEFYIPQLVQLLVSFETDSMALSDFLMNYSERFPHFCLITFWYLQSYMFELKDSPNSYSFHIVRSFINDIQNIMFNDDASKQNANRFRENTHPALVLVGSIAASVAYPGANSIIRPIILSQSRQQKSTLFRLANFQKNLTKNLTLKNRIIKDEDEIGLKEEHIKGRHSEGDRLLPLVKGSSIFNNSSIFSDISTTDVSSRVLSRTSLLSKRKSEDLQVLRNSRELSTFVTHSLPDLSHPDVFGMEDLSIIPVLSASSSFSITSMGPDQHSNQNFRLVPDQKVKQLHINYYKKETEFIMAIQNLSSRLSQIPKEARLTALRAELAIINNTLLPSEIDIPQLLPISSQQNKKFHQILRLNINEAFVLNSAERVPFLLLVEFLNEEMDFDPQTEHNRSILAGGLGESIIKKSDDSQRVSSPLLGSSNTKIELEKDLGDISVISLSNERHMLAQQSQTGRMSHNSPSSSLASVSSLIPEANVSTKDLSAQMRIAAVMLRQLEKSGQANSQQAASIKSRIIESMKKLQDNFENIRYQQINELNSVNIGQTGPDAGERKLENDFKLGEDWKTKKERIRKASAFGHLRNWELCSVIAKNGDDLPQEAFACQLISIISTIWKVNSIDVWTKNMKILVTSANSGLVETINNAMSIHSIKKLLTESSISSGENLKGDIVSLKQYFAKIYGSETNPRYRKAQDNFARSLAAYSIICYVLQIKDRHNGNIMLDNEGHIIHIDFGFLLSNSPGSVGFEAAPFKLTQEYVDVLGGFESPNYVKFKELCKKSFRILRKNCKQLVTIVELMLKDSTLPCFKNGSQTSVLLKQRLQLDLSDEDCDNFVEVSLLGKSIGSVYTRLYDQFQLITQGIYS